MKLKPDELEALHECLSWLRQPGNNPLNYYSDELEDFHKNCKLLMDKIKHVLPEGSTRARIRATTRMSRQMQEGKIGDTLGDESRGMVVVPARLCEKAKLLTVGKHSLSLLLTSNSRREFAFAFPALAI